CVLLAFYFFYGEQYVASSIWLGLGCLARFEAWIAAPVLLFAYLTKRGVTLATVVRGSLLFGSVSAVWLIFGRGLAPEGSYVVDTSFTLERFVRWIYLGYITVRFTPVLVILLAGAGLWFLWRTKLKRDLWPLVLLFALFCIAILF